MCSPKAACGTSSEHVSSSWRWGSGNPGLAGFPRDRLFHGLVCFRFRRAVAYPRRPWSGRPHAGRSELTRCRPGVRGKSRWSLSGSGESGSSSVASSGRRLSRVVLGHRTLGLHCEDSGQIGSRGPPKGRSFLLHRNRELVIELGNVALVQKRVSLLQGADPRQPQFLGATAPARSRSSAPSGRALAANRPHPLRFRGQALLTPPAWPNARPRADTSCVNRTG